MRVLIINTSERMGGAAIAANRLMESLNGTGIDTGMLVLHKMSHSDKVHTVGKSWQRKFTFIWERLIIWTNNLFSRKNLFRVSIANTGFDVTRLPVFKEADIIHLHWINQGMLSLHNIQQVITSGKPVVWTMHDMWECTSICHYSYSCESFKNECGNCHFLRFPGNNDLSHRVFKRKQSILSPARINIVTVSNWLASQVRQSTLLKGKPVTVIPNTLSLSNFRILNKVECRQALSLPDKRIIVFGAARIDDPIKGFPTLMEAIRLLIQRKDFRSEELHLIFFGKTKYPQQILPLIPVSYTAMGWVSQVEELSQIYSAADVAVSASLYETFGQTLIEAQSCGCLPVSFGNSGQADIIRHKENGYLADYQSAESLADGIKWGLTEGKERVSPEAMRNEVMTKYSGKVVAGQYINLYTSLLASKL